MPRSIHVARNVWSAFVLMATAVLFSCAWWPVGELEVIPFDATSSDPSPH